MGKRIPYAVKHHVNGELLSIREASEKYDIKYFTLIGRMRRFGISLEEAVKYVPGERKPKPINRKKPWSKMTSEEIYRNKREKCVHCPYRSGSGTSAADISVMTCDYSSKMHKCRLVDPRDCEHWKDEPVKRERWT